MKAMGAEVVGNSPAEFAQILRSDLRLWTKVIKDAGIKN
jgi:tripartite-type tricarboxylate transporter receptor subunit TctC